MKRILLAILALLTLNACSHSLSFRGNHFATPIVSDHRWGGLAAASFFGSHPVTLVSDIYATSPNGTPRPGQKDLEVEDMFGLNSFGVNLELNPMKGLAIYSTFTTTGVKWQFLNNSGTDGWVAAIQGGVTGLSKSESMSYSSGGGPTNTASVESSARGTQFAGSFGYQVKGMVPYVSVLTEDLRSETNLTNSHGTWQFKSNGRHNFYSVGLTSTRHWKLRGFHVGIEYSLVDMKWESRTHSGHSFGFNIGGNW